MIYIFIEAIDELCSYICVHICAHIFVQIYIFKIFWSLKLALIRHIIIKKNQLNEDIFKIQNIVSKIV